MAKNLNGGNRGAFERGPHIYRISLMKIKRYEIKSLIFREDDNEFVVGYSNRGEPYRDGLEFSFRDDRLGSISVLLEDEELEQLYNHIGKFLNK